MFTLMNLVENPFKTFSKHTINPHRGLQAVDSSHRDCVFPKSRPHEQSPRAKPVPFGFIRFGVVTCLRSTSRTRRSQPGPNRVLRCISIPCTDGSAAYVIAFNAQNLMWNVSQSCHGKISCCASTGTHVSYLCQRYPSVVSIKYKTYRYSRMPPCNLTNPAEITSTRLAFPNLAFSVITRRATAARNTSHILSDATLMTRYLILSVFTTCLNTVAKSKVSACSITV